MKKSLLSLIITASLLAGCASTSEQVSYVDLKKEGASIYEQAVVGTYKPSLIQDIESVRTIVNTAFLAAKPSYERYLSELMNSAALGNYFSAVEAAESDEDKKAVYNALTPENKKVVDEFNDSSVMKEIMLGLGESVTIILAQDKVFSNLDTKAMLTSVGWKELIAEKDKLSFTVEQLAYLNDTVVSAYNNYQIVSAFSNAQ